LGPFGSLGLSSITQLMRSESSELISIRWNLTSSVHRSHHVFSQQALLAQ
jgi:hypothetical protein